LEGFEGKNYSVMVLENK